MEMPSLRPKQAKAVRWLSHDQACDTMRHILPCIVMSLHRVREMTLKRWVLCTRWRNGEFVACLFMLCDILPALSSLSRNFQVSNAHLQQETTPGFCCL